MGQQPGKAWYGLNMNLSNKADNMSYRIFVIMCRRRETEAWQKKEDQSNNQFNHVVLRITKSYWNIWSEIKNDVAHVFALVRIVLHLISRPLFTVCMQYVDIY